MAKKKTPKMNGASDYAQMQRNIQKAKGNPNKNVHQKKNGSDYHVRDKVQPESTQQQSTNRMPLGIKIALGIAFVTLLVLIILINTSLKDNLIAVNTTSLLTGLSCLLVYYSRRYLNKKETTWFKILGVVLIVMGILYTFIGGYGLYYIFFHQ